MMYYIAHEYGGNPANFERAKKVAHDLQVNDPLNCYISPLTTFSYLQYNELGNEQEIELCLDLLSVCDVLIVASDFINSKGVQKEIDFANSVGMDVIFLEDATE